MAESLVPGLLHRESEFVVAVDPTSGQSARRFGTCGPCGAHSVATNALGHYVSTASVYGLMRQHGLCDVSGASTIAGLAQTLALLGCAIVEQVNYQEPWPAWDTFFQAHAGVHPFQFETANGQALVDSLTGLGENASNLQYHHLAVLGRHTGGYSPHAQRTLPPGYWCADGDNFAGGNDNANSFNAANVLQFYPDTVIAAARPVGAVAVKGGVPVSIVPAGWTDDPAHDKLTAPNGHFCVRGIRAFVLGYPGGWPADNLPREEEHPQHPMELGNPAIPDGVQQTFNRSVVEWIASDTPHNAGPKAGCFEMWTGAELQAYRQALAAAQKATSDAQAAASAAQQAASQAQAALASAQAQRDALSAQLATANGKIAAAKSALG